MTGRRAFLVAGYGLALVGCLDHGTARAPLPRNSPATAALAPRGPCEFSAREQQQLLSKLAEQKPSAAVARARAMMTACPLLRRVLGSATVRALIRLERDAEAQAEGDLALQTRFIGSGKSEVQAALSTLPCRSVPVEPAPSLASLQTFTRATSASSPDLAALAELSQQPGWLGTVSRAWLSASSPDLGVRQSARRQLEALAGERGVLEPIVVPGRGDAGSNWYAAPLDRGFLLGTISHLERLTDAAFRPKFQLENEHFAASPDGAWAATWGGQRGTVFHSASGSEVLRFECPAAVSNVTFDAAATHFDVTNEHDVTTRLSVFGSEPARKLDSAAPAAVPPVKSNMPSSAPPADVAEGGESSLSTEGQTVVVASGEQVLFFDAVQQTVQTFRLPDAAKAQILVGARMALLDQTTSAQLVHLDHPQSGVLRFAKGAPRSWLLSPAGHYVAARRPVGPANGESILYSTATGAALSGHFDSNGEQFFGPDEQFYFFDPYGRVFQYDPRGRKPARALGPVVQSFLGNSSSDGRDFLSWLVDQPRQVADVLNFASGELTHLVVHEKNGIPATDVRWGGQRLVDLSSSRNLALFEALGFFSLQNRQRELLEFDAQAARLIPATGDLAVITRAGSIEVRSVEGELKAQLLVTPTAYVTRGQAFSSHGQLDRSTLACRVGRHFAPAELCWSAL